MDTEIDYALQTASACRLEASRIRQCGIFPVYAKWLIENAKAAEKWAVQQARHPSQICAADGG